jgi:hypothetical protein
MNVPENMVLYEMARSLPPEAIKTITMGRLKGFSDVNPQARIKRLTEMFGPCGIGWWYEITEKRLVEDPKTGQTAAFVDILLYYVEPRSGITSHGIPGTGGSTFVAKETRGPYMSDEAFKMALTDAISVSAKAIGVAADVYFQADRTKYTSSPDKSPQSPDNSPPPTKNNSGQKPNSTRLATEAQKELLRSIVNAEQLQTCNQAYGDDWSKMPASHAAALIKKIQG